MNIYVNLKCKFKPVQTITNISCINIRKNIYKQQTWKHMKTSKTSQNIEHQALTASPWLLDCFQVWKRNGTQLKHIHTDVAVLTFIYWCVQLKDFIHVMLYLQQHLSRLDQHGHGPASKQTCSDYAQALIPL